jgi:hypothetical protein
MAAAWVYREVRRLIAVATACPLAALILAAAPMLWPTMASAQTDEIQVYTGELAAPREYTLTVHANYTPSGQTLAAFPGAVVAEHSLNGAAEWAYGVNDWFEAGLYFPVYTRSRDGAWLLDGAKLRALFAVPHADEREFFYGMNFELSRNSSAWDASRWGGEIRPIIGWRRGPFDFIVNPILDTRFDGLSHLTFAPAARVAYNYSKQWAFALEHYADFGEISRLSSADEQQHVLFTVADYSGKVFDVEAGIGFGLTSASDDVVLKLILTRSL